MRILILIFLFISTSVNAYHSDGFYETGIVPVTISYSNPVDHSISYAFNIFEYVKIGEVVFYSIRLQFTPTRNSSTGILTIIDLPFPVVIQPLTQNSGMVSFQMNSPSFPSGHTQIHARAIQSDNSIRLYTHSPGGVLTQLNGVNFTNGTAYDMRISGFYFTEEFEHMNLDPTDVYLIITAIGVLFAIAFLIRRIIKVVERGWYGN
jgi:hypothetical protein